MLKETMGEGIGGGEGGGIISRNRAHLVLKPDIEPIKSIQKSCLTLNFGFNSSTRPMRAPLLHDMKTLGMPVYASSKRIEQKSTLIRMRVKV